MIISCLTVRQPYPEFIALGVKRYETRTRRPPAQLVGRTIGILAGQRIARGAKSGDRFGPLGDQYLLCHDDDDGSWWLYNEPDHRDAGAIWLPTGCVCMVATLGAGLPIVDGHGPARPDGAYVASWKNGELWMYDGSTPFDISDQRPWGDWTPGRVAWPLTEVRRITGVPARGTRAFVDVHIPEV